MGEKQNWLAINMLMATLKCLVSKDEVLVQVSGLAWLPHIALPST